MFRLYGEQKEEIKTIRPRTITLELSDADCERISDQAAMYGLTVGELLQNFIGDLVDGTYSNGSDERMYADQYCERCWFSWFNKNLLNHLARDLRDVEDFLDTWNEKQYSEEHPEEYADDRAELVDGEKLWFEEEIEEAMKFWKPDYEIKMNDEISICKKWLEERKRMLD